MVSGFALTQASTKWSEARKRVREQELLKVGDCIHKAIGNYYNQTPGVVKQYPSNLEALLKDDRFPEPRCYLRKMYVDPVTQREAGELLKPLVVTLWGFIVYPKQNLIKPRVLDGCISIFKTENITENGTFHTFL